ncbi:hypothetical protein N1851_009894 [Merluccius polli]|uniref:Uncharacterized protein n=1 Tax=Merluccius polli TaxID=89951 RepID=A0AA47N0D5_MERPO|nr:hypothetical protein N1851_009894 [Merluccius polli]
MEYLAGLQGLSESQKLQFVLGSLEGEAKREVQASSEDKRDSAKHVFDFLATLYGDITPMRELFTRLRRRSDNGLGVGDALLRDQFLLGLQDGPIRQSLRLQLRRDPTLSFEDLRKETLALELDHSEAINQPTCMAASSAYTPAPPSAVDWKRELHAEIMKDVKEQMADDPPTGVTPGPVYQPTFAPGTVLLRQQPGAEKTPRSADQFEVPVGRPG